MPRNSGTALSARSPGKGGRIFPTIFFSIFTVVGVFATVALTRSTLSGQESRSWTPVACRIVSSGYALPEGNNDDYRFNVRYQYNTAGRQYTSEQYSDNDLSDSSFEPIQRALLEFRQGTSATCYVNPANLSLSVLHAPSRSKILLSLLPLIFVVVGVAGLWFMWRGGRTGASGPALSMRTGLMRGKRPGPLFGLIFMLAGLGFFAIFVRPIWRAVTSMTWPQTEATVVRSSVRAHSGDDGSTYSVDVLYRYEVDGTQFLSNRYDLMGGSSSGYSGKKKVVDSLPRGSNLQVYYNPSDPVISTIQRGFSLVMLFALLPLVFVLVGGLILVAALRAPKEAPASVGSALGTSARRAAAPLTGSLTRAPHQRAASETPAPAHFTSGKGRRMAFLGLIFATLFWNGITWTILIATWGEWFPMIFMSLFVVIGLVLIGGAIHSGLAMFNPKLNLTLSNATPRLGDTVRLDYKLDGRFDRIHHLTIVLEGREEAEYRRGTTTHTDRNVFSRLDLVDTMRQVDIASGNVSFVIPANTMHTFAAPFNAVKWFVVVCGEIANWADVKDEFPLKILPRAVGREVG